MTEPSPLVSIVVPTYQNGPFINQTMHSILAQSYAALEIVVADHSSTDGTWERLQAYAADPRVRLLRTDPGGGAERNWNRVTAEATGKYLKLVCADDLLYETCVEEQVAAIDGAPDVALVAAKRDIIDARGNVLIAGRGLAGLRGRVDGRQAIRTTVRAGTNIFGEPACVLLRTDLVRKIGGWSAQQPYLIDEDMYARVLQHGDLYAIPRSLAAFRVSSRQWSVRLTRDQAAQATAFHRRLLDEAPTIVSAADVRLGSMRAVGAAWGRRMAYLAWRRRMRHDANDEDLAPRDD